VPIYHRALADNLEKPVVFLNIGGVANVTYVGRKGDLIAFDTGPGNALIDDWMLKKTGYMLDTDGKTALSGKVNEAVLKKLLSHPFFAAPVPKSLDRNAFASGLWENLSAADGAATLAAFTVRSVVEAGKFFPEQPLQWIVTGGGRHNKFLMQKLRRQIHVPVISIDDLELDGDAIEAEAFAYLAVRSVQGLPISFPSTTGVPEPMTGGKLCA
jgi:anhydro-N-acetylmuramic acid kinase